jgi:hypothetical protein
MAKDVCMMTTGVEKSYTIFYFMLTKSATPENKITGEGTELMDHVERLDTWTSG